jgi:uncharacterized protein (TIGR02466 family)
MPVDLFFPVPFLVHDIEPAVRDVIRSKVLAYLESDRARQDITPSPEESVSTSYYKPQASILVDAELRELQEFVIGAGKAFLEQTLQLPPRELEIERAWINVFEPGAQEAQHTHDGSLLSCSYYVEAPQNCGCIGFPDPISARRSYREFTQTTGDHILTRRELAFDVQPGRLVLFESWVPHYVQCNKSDQARISIAMNLRHAAERPRQRSITSARSLPADLTLPDQAAGMQSAPAVNRQAKPFLFNELFDVNINLAVNQQTGDTIPAVVIDDFLKQPERVREVVGSTPAANWKHEDGGRNFVDYYDCRLRFPIRFPNKMIAVAQQVIRKTYSLDTRPSDASVDVNWFMQINEKRADFAVPHNDMTLNVRRSFTCIVYLNSSSECSGGTAFFRFKPSNSLVVDDSYARSVHEDSRISETGRDYWPDSTATSWEQVAAVDMVPGRLLIFPSEYFHAAFHPQNSFFDFPRLTLAFWMVC